LLSTVLPELTQVLGTQRLPKEVQVPLGWPGTHCPNFSAWQPGDIVLVHKGAGFAGAIIPAAQSASFNLLMLKHKDVTHAGIYTGSGMMVDATPGRPIAEVSVWDYCQTRKLQVRRLSDPSLPATSGMDIVREARLYVGQPYSTAQAVFAKLWPGTKAFRTRLYCSTLVEAAVVDATAVDLAADPSHQPLYPAILAGHPDLVDVMLEWRLA
jgi:uncharacterized protein YycO